MKSGKGTHLNKVNIGKTNTITGDPDVKLEKPSTIILFPGGSVEISRTTDNKYWVHVAVDEAGTVEGARVTTSEPNEDVRTIDRMMEEALETEVVNHIAFLVGKK